MIGRVLPRCALLALAAGAIVWLVHDLRAVVLDAHGRAISNSVLASSSPDSRAASRALADFDRAASGNADPSPRLDEARLLIGIGRDREAARILDGVVRGNPGNVVAWDLLANATVGFEPLRAEQALAQLRRLYGRIPGLGIDQGFLLAPDGVREALGGYAIGHVEVVTTSGRSAIFVGWAGVPGQGSRPPLTPADSILIVVRGQVVFSGRPTVPRADVARTHPGSRPDDLGFELRVPLASLTSHGRTVQGQVFATTGDIASALPIACGRLTRLFSCGRSAAPAPSIVGFLEGARVAGAAAQLFGWAGIKTTEAGERALLPTSVQAVAAGRTIASGTTTLLRPDVARVERLRTNLRVGFVLSVPLAALGAARRVAVYAGYGGTRVPLPTECGGVAMPVPCP